MSRVAIEQEEEERRGGRKGGEEQVTDIKSNNPYLAGGEKHNFLDKIFNKINYF